MVINYDKFDKENQGDVKEEVRKELAKININITF